MGEAGSCRSISRVCDPSCKEGARLDRPGRGASAPSPTGSVRPCPCCRGGHRRGHPDRLRADRRPPSQTGSRLDRLHAPRRHAGRWPRVFEPGPVLRPRHPAGDGQLRSRLSDLPRRTSEAGHHHQHRFPDGRRTLRWCHRTPYRYFRPSGGRTGRCRPDRGRTGRRFGHIDRRRRIGDVGDDRRPPHRRAARRRGLGGRNTLAPAVGPRRSAGRGAGPGPIRGHSERRGAGARGHPGRAFGDDRDVGWPRWRWRWPSPRSCFPLG